MAKEGWPTRTKSSNVAIILYTGWRRCTSTVYTQSKGTGQPKNKNKRRKKTCWIHFNYWSGEGKFFFFFLNILFQSMFLAWIHSLEKRADRTNFSRRRTLPDLKHQDGYACSRASHRKLQNRSWWTTRQDEPDSMAGRQWFTLLLITSNTVQLSQWRKQTISVTSSTSWTVSQRSASRGRSSGQRKARAQPDEQSDRRNLQGRN